MFVPLADYGGLPRCASDHQGALSLLALRFCHYAEPLLVVAGDCQASAIQMVWSPTGNHVAYPLRGERSEIRSYDLEADQTQVLIRLDTGGLLSGLSWSPDSKYLAFSQSDGRLGTPRSIWVASTDGATRQLLVDGGLLPNWSPDGKHILYARPGTSRLLDWYLLELNSTVQ